LYPIATVCMYDTVDKVFVRRALHCKRNAKVFF